MGIADPRYPKGAMKFNAGGWELLKAKLFGKKYHERVGRYTIVAYYYGETYYVTRYDAFL